MISSFAVGEACALLLPVVILDIGPQVLTPVLATISLVTCGAFTLGNFTSRIFCISSILVCFVCSMIAFEQYQGEPEFPYPLETIVQIHGVLCSDESDRIDGSTFVTVALSQAVTYRGDTGSASGRLPVLVETDHDLLLAGQEGMFSGQLISGEDQSLFIADKIKMITDTRWHHLRRAAIQWITQQLHALKEPECTIACALVIGRIPSSALLYDQAIAAGCAHILALSGMHVHILLGVFAFVLYRITSRRYASVLLMLLGCAYVAIIGPKPSLIRSVLLFVISLWFPFLSLRTRLSLCLVLQVMCFPATSIAVGAQLSYTALTAIILASGQIANRLAVVMPQALAKVAGVTISASLGTAPLSFSLFGAWRIVGLVSGPLIAPLVAIHLLLSCVYLVFPASIFQILLHQNALLFSRMLDRAEQWSYQHETLNDVRVLLLCMVILLTSLIILQYACRVTYRRHQKAYDVGFSLRFPPGNNTSSW